MITWILSCFRSSHKVSLFSIFEGRTGTDQHIFSFLGSRIRLFLLSFCLWSSEFSRFTEEQSWWCKLDSVFEISLFEIFSLLEFWSLWLIDLVCIFELDKTTGMWYLPLRRIGDSLLIDTDLVYWLLEDGSWLICKVAGLPILWLSSTGGR